MVLMKRLALLVTVTVLATIFVSSPLLASPPRIEKSFMSFRAFISHYIVLFINPFQGYVEPPIGDKNDSGMLGGDADDYANGREDNIDGEKKRNGRLNAGPAVIGPEGVKPIYRLYNSH
jgi:hypothetical protein